MSIKNKIKNFYKKYKYDILYFNKHLKQEFTNLLALILIFIIMYFFGDDIHLP